MRPETSWTWNRTHSDRGRASSRRVADPVGLGRGSESAHPLGGLSTATLPKVTSSWPRATLFDSSVSTTSARVSATTRTVWFPGGSSTFTVRLIVTLSSGAMMVSPSASNWLSARTDQWELRASTRP